MNLQTILTIIGTIVITLFSTFLARTMELYIPDKKTMSSYIKKSFLFTIKYILPISIMVLFIIRDKVDVLFVFVMCSMFFIILINIIFHIVFVIFDILKGHLELIKKSLDLTTYVGDSSLNLIESLVNKFTKK